MKYLVSFGNVTILVDSTNHDMEMDEIILNYIHSTAKLLSKVDGNMDWIPFGVEMIRVIKRLQGMRR